ncbi:hypothetical protein ACFV5N_12645, partial [Streptomyces sp. NPDC059853]|uniref:hypothetical protein n=1 Tax=Streptomyces sp. NPDC059853 TaxID=3346973 RepID=UPI0036665945
MAAHEQQRPVTTRRERLLAAVLRDGGEWTTSRAARLYGRAAPGRATYADADTDADQHPEVKVLV